MKKRKAHVSGSRSFNDLKSRALADVLIVCGDGLTGLRNAVEAVYPPADVQLCVVHYIRNVTKFVAWKDRKALCARMRPINTARSPLKPPSWRWIALIRPGLLATHVGSGLAQPLARLDDILPLPGGTATHHLHHQCHRESALADAQNIASRKVFLNDESVLKILFLNIRNFTDRWTRPQGWDRVMNQLPVLLADRLRLYWIEAMQYLNMEPLAEQKEEALRNLGDVA